MEDAKEANIVIFTRLSATESSDAVLNAIRKLFPDAEAFDCDAEGIRCVTKDASTIREMIFGRRILDTVRSILLSNRHGNDRDCTTLELNRQAAAAGKLSLDAGGCPLGPIIVEIQSPDMEEFIDWFAPRTEKGRPVESNVR